MIRLALLLASVALAQAPEAPATPGSPATPAEFPPAPEAPAATTYRLDPAASAIYVRVSRERGTLGSKLAHDHVIVAAAWTGTVVWGGPGGCAGEVRVPVDALQVDPPEWRTRLGVGEPIGERDRRSIRKSMLAEGQLSADAHPWIVFQVLGCEDARMRGRLTVRGVAKEVTVPLDAKVDGDTLTAKGTFSARATEFGFEPYAAFLGAVRNRDEMAFTLDVVGTAVRSP